MHLPSSCCPWRSNTPSASLAPSYSGSLKSNTSFGLGPSSSYAGKLRSPHVNAVNIKKNERKMSKNEHVTIVVVVLRIGSLRLKNEPSSSSSIRTFRSKPWRTWLDEQASEEKKLSHGWMNKQVKIRQGKAVVPAF